MSRKIIKRGKQEKQLEESLRIIKEVIARGIRQPTYFFKRGDRVEYGNIEWVKILEVYENGMYYKILKFSDDIRYGRKVGFNLNFDYILWTEIRPYRTKEEMEKNNRMEENDDITFQYQQRNISSLLHTIYKGSGIDLNPDYQRELIWSEEQKVALIDSIFKNIDIGKFAIIRRKFDQERNNYYEILDGKQRIQALMDFYECRIKYKGLTYNDLHWRDRIHFREYNISWAETEPLTNEQKYRYFLKLNTSGTPVSEEHMNKVKEMLKKLKKC